MECEPSLHYIADDLLSARVGMDEILVCNRGWGRGARLNQERPAASAGGHKVQLLGAEPTRSADPVEGSA